MTRGFPVADCPRCEAPQLVWREPATNAARCLGCDAPLPEGAVQVGDAAAVVERNDYVFLDVTHSAEPCGCETCPGQNHCHHTSEAGP